MFNRAVFLNIAVLGIGLLLLSCAAAHAGPSTLDTCTVLISSRIKPYMEAVNGLKQQLEQVQEIKTRYLFINDTSKADVLNELAPQNSVVVAVGPEALLRLNSWELGPRVHKFFTMVLDPRKRIALADKFCGIFLAITPDVQIPAIKHKLSWVNKMGILYDPANNSDYVRSASAMASSQGFEIIPVPAYSQDSVPTALRKNWGKIDALLLIPDPSIISSSLVTLIIKEGISNRTPVIGYNHFFLHNGALMAFVYNYQEIGKQTADMILSVLLYETHCNQRPAELETQMNKPLARQLQIETEPGP